MSPAHCWHATLRRGLTFALPTRAAKPGEVALAQVYRLFDRDYSFSDQTAQLLELMTLVMQPIQRRLDALDDRLDRMENAGQGRRNTALVMGAGLRVLCGRPTALPA